MSQKRSKKAWQQGILSHVKRGPVLVVLVILLAGAVSVPLVRADTVQDQINSLNSQNTQNQANLNALQTQATSYQNAINLLQSQISGIESAIAASQAKQVQLQQEITQDQANIALQKQILGDDVKAIYVDGQMSTIEELATSKNLSDFVDAQTYRNAVQTKIQTTLAQITQLEYQLKDQQTQVAQLLQTQQAQQTQLDTDQSQQQQLLSYNQGQQSQYNQQIQANNAQIAQLVAEQAAANASIARSAHVVGSSGGSGGLCDIGDGNGGYPMPWCNAPQDSITDANGFPNRECTSFAYWYFTSVEGQTGFSVSGNAGWWWETSNYPVITWDPSAVKDGALGIEPSSTFTNLPVQSLHGGYYGHVMVVKAKPGENYPGYGVVPDDYVLVASMNEDEAGHFLYNLWPVSYLYYINPQ